MKFQVVPKGLNVRSGPGTQHGVLDVLPQGTVIDEASIAGWVPVKMSDGSVGWVSRDFLAKTSEAPVVTPTGEPAWITWARSKLGSREVPGARDNPEIVSWFRLTTLPPEDWHDATAWCAVFVNAALFLNGVQGLRSALAKAWLKFGRIVEVPKTGDLVIWEHHVAFYLREAAGNRIQVIGGNQSDGVTITTFPKENILGYRRVV